MLDASLTAQLKTHFEKITRPIELVTSLDDSPKSAELAELLDQVASLSDKISVVRRDDNDWRPSFAIARVGTDVEVRFAGLPLGHELTSFVLALLQVGGHPPAASAEAVETIEELEGDYHFETFFSLTCQNCPDVVQALNVMSVLNPNVTHTAIDGALFQDEVEARQVMAVPSVFLNGEPFDQGRMTLEQIVAKLDAAGSEKAVAKIDAKDPFDVLVVGGGPAGATAAVYAARKGINTGVVSERFGGQVLDTMGIENFISVPYTEGPKLATALEQHVKEYEVDIMDLQRAARLVPATEPGGLATVELESGASVQARAVVLSTGARWRQTGVPGEAEYRNKGVTYCPHCDGPLFKGKRVAVIGGGNSGVEAAIDLAGIVAHVTLIEFDPQLRADEVLQRKLRSLPNVDRRGQRQDDRDGRRRREAHRADLRGPRDRRGAHRPPRGRVRADRPAAQHRLAGRRPRAVAPGRGRGRRPRRHLGARRVRRRRLHDRAVQADRHRHGRGLHRGAQRLRPPGAHVGPGRRSRRGGRRLAVAFSARGVTPRAEGVVP